MSKLVAFATATTSLFGLRTTFPKVPNWTGHHQLSHPTPCPMTCRTMTNQPQHMTLQASDLTSLCNLFAKHCLFPLATEFSLVAIGYTGTSHTVQSYTAASLFDNKKRSSLTEACKPCGFCKACNPCLAADIKRQNSKRPLPCQRPQAVGPASKTAKSTAADITVVTGL